MQWEAPPVLYRVLWPGKSGGFNGLNFLDVQLFSIWTPWKVNLNCVCMLNWVAQQINHAIWCPFDETRHVEFPHPNPKQSPNMCPRLLFWEIILKCVFIMTFYANYCQFLPCTHEWCYTSSSWKPKEPRLLLLFRSMTHSWWAPGEDVPYKLKIYYLVCILFFAFFIVMACFFKKNASLHFMAPQLLLTSMAPTQPVFSIARNAMSNSTPICYPCVLFQGESHRRGWQGHSVLGRRTAASG